MGWPIKLFILKDWFCPRKELLPIEFATDWLPIKVLCPKGELLFCPKGEEFVWPKRVDCCCCCWLLPKIPCWAPIPWFWFCPTGFPKDGWAPPKTVFDVLLPNTVPVVVAALLLLPTAWLFPKRVPLPPVVMLGWLVPNREEPWFPLWLLLLLLAPNEVFPKVVWGLDCWPPKVPPVLPWSYLIIRYFEQIQFLAGKEIYFEFQHLNMNTVTLSE